MRGRVGVHFRAPRLGVTLLLTCSLLPAQTGAQLVSAGGTFPDPIYQQWIHAFDARQPGLPIVYRAVGSEQAIEQLKDGRVDFAASDFAPSPEMQAKLAVRLIPTLVGAAVPVYNLPNVKTTLRFTAGVLADIYLGKITHWNDPRIKALNRRAALPPDAITVVHRSDGSGTSYVWTDFISSGSADWKRKFGASVAPDWPAGVGQKGNEGIASFVSQTPFSIGYVEFIYALQQHLTYASVKNPAGVFVEPGIDTITAAASTAAQDRGPRISIVNAPGRSAYPVCSFTWFLVPLKMNSAVKRERLSAFLEWALSRGQHQVGALGYVQLPQAVADRERQAVKTLWTR